MDEKQGSQDVAKQGLISYNSLSYKLPPDLSVTVSRSNTNQFFSQNNYLAGGTAVNILNTGSAYIYGPNSYLAFTIINRSDGTVTFGQGTAVNLIKRLTITTRSGDVIERIDNVNVLHYITARYGHSVTWQNSIQFGELMGKGVQPIAPEAELRVVIPLSEISGLFRYQNLLPSCLMSGLRIEFEFEPALNALVGAGPTTGLNYELKDVVISADSYILTDLILQQLNMSASSTRLEIVINTFFNTQASRAGNSNVNLESRKAVSRALRAFFKERPPKGIGASNVDAFASLAVSTDGIIDAQVRVGSLYFPNSSLRNSNPEHNAAELYAMTVRSFSTLGGDKAVGTSLTQYKTGHAVLGVALERSTSHDLAGIPISNSRVLALNATFARAPAGGIATLIDFYLEHIVLIRAFLSNATQT